MFLRTQDLELKLSACFLFPTPFSPKCSKTNVRLVQDKLSSSWHLEPVGLCLLTLTRLEVTEHELEESSTDAIGVNGFGGCIGFFRFCIDVAAL